MLNQWADKSRSMVSVSSSLTPNDVFISFVLAFIHFVSLFQCITLQSAHPHQGAAPNDWTLNCSTGTAETQTLSHGKDTSQFKDVFVDINTIMSVLFPFLCLNHDKRHTFLQEVWGHWVHPMWDTDNRHDAKACWASKLSAHPHCCGRTMKEMNLH